MGHVIPITPIWGTVTARLILYMIKLYTKLKYLALAVPEIFQGV